MPKVIEKYANFIKLERSKGYQNTAIMGGFNALDSSWPAEARESGLPEPLIKKVSQLLKNYEGKSPEDRRLELIELTSWLGLSEIGSFPPAPGGEPDAQPVPQPVVNPLQATPTPKKAAPTAQPRSGSKSVPPARPSQPQIGLDASVDVNPNWSMGLKISIGSASMFNKALEMIEAKHLFDVRPEQIEVVVHPQSIIHSMVGYVDGSVLAQLGAPDMRTAIGYALTYPERSPLNVDRLDFAKLSRLDFEAPDEERFPALRLARTALTRGGLQGAVMNAAEEVAFHAFVGGRIGFLAMADIAEAVMDRLAHLPPATSMDDVFAADEEARRVAAGLIG